MSDSTSRGNSPKNFSKKKVGNQVTFTSPSRFSGGQQQATVGPKSQYKPAPVRITQHKG